jgi:hypothetical protein
VDRSGSAEPWVQLRHALRGPLAKLDAVQHAEKFQDLITKVALNVQGVGVIRGWSGESMMNQVQRYANVI